MTKAANFETPLRVCLTLGAKTIAGMPEPHGSIEIDRMCSHAELLSVAAMLLTHIQERGGSVCPDDMETLTGAARAMATGALVHDVIRAERGRP